MKTLTAAMKVEMMPMMIRRTMAVMHPRSFPSSIFCFMGSLDRSLPVALIYCFTVHSYTTAILLLLFSSCDAVAWKHEIIYLALSHEECHKICAVDCVCSHDVMKITNLLTRLVLVHRCLSWLLVPYQEVRPSSSSNLVLLALLLLLEPEQEPELEPLRRVTGV